MMTDVKTETSGLQTNMLRYPNLSMAAKKACS